MNKERNLKIFLFSLVAITFLCLMFYFYNFFNPRHGELISSKNISQIRNSLSNTVEDLEFLSLSSIEGNKEFLALTFKDTRYSGEEFTYNAFFDVKNKKVIPYISYKDLFVNFTDACLIKYIDKDIFLVLGADGTLYTIQTKNGNFKVYNITSLDVSKNNIFKYLYTNNSLYIITRDTISKFNEKTLANNKVYQITFKSGRYKKATVIDYTFNSEDFIYSFVLDGNGNVGVLGSSSILLPSEEVNKYKLPADDIYLQALPSENKNYKFIDQSQVWVRFLHDDSLVQIPEEVLSNSYLTIHNFINKALDKNVSILSNIPLVITNDFMLYSSHNYEDFLYGLPILPSSNLIKLSTEANIEDSTIISTIRSDIKCYDYKKYLCFISSNDGLVGIDKFGNPHNIVKSNIVFPYKNLILYFDGESVRYIK